MRVWFMVATLTLGLIGWLGYEGQASGGGESLREITKEGPNPIPTPKAP
jgi:hypothetical protein